MPESLTALFATAIYQARSALADPEPVVRTVGLMAHSAADEGLALEVHDRALVVNHRPVTLDAPGAADVRNALASHQIFRLELPPSLTASQWREVVELISSTPGLYHSLDDLRDALRFTVPDAVVSGTSDEGDLRDALFEIPGLRASVAAAEPARAPDPHDAEIAELNGRLDPLLKAAERARDNGNFEQLAHTLLAILALEESNRDDRRAIVARERRRVVAVDVMEAMARSVAKPRAPAVVARILGMLGHDGALALITALSGATTLNERRAFMDALVACRDCDEVLVDALNHPRPEVARDVAEVVGRRQVPGAVPFLRHLLRHPQTDVRTAAWHALESIGTRDAAQALRT